MFFHLPALNSSYFLSCRMGVKSNGALLGHLEAQITHRWDEARSGTVQCWDLPRHGLESDNSNDVKQEEKMQQALQAYVRGAAGEKMISSKKPPLSLQSKILSVSLLLNSRPTFSRRNGFLPKKHSGFRGKGEVLATARFWGPLLRGRSLYPSLKSRNLFTSSNTK